MRTTAFDVRGWDEAQRAGPTPPCWPRAAASTPTWPPSCTPRAAPASRKAWCCRTGTWWRARAASPLPGADAARPPAGGAAAQLRLRPEPADHRLPGGATAVLINHLFARDIVEGGGARAHHRPGRGAAAVDPAGALDWPADCTLRYLTNSGGAMPVATVAACARAAARRAVPDVRPDRSLPLDLPAAVRTGAPPRFDGRAIPNAEVMVVRPTARPARRTSRASWCTAARWSRSATGTIPAKTAERFRPAPGQDPALPLPRWRSGRATPCAGRRGLPVLHRPQRRHDQGVRLPHQPDRGGRSGARHRPGGEAAAFGVPHPQLGQAIVLLALPREPTRCAAALLAGMPAPPAGLYGAGPRRAPQRGLPAQPERQDRPQPAAATVLPDHV
jgi:hypothetical protein